MTNDSGGINKVLIVTVISGFLPQFEYNDVKLLQKMGCEVHYASNFTNPVYRCNEKELLDAGIHIHRLTVEKSPMKVLDNLRTVRDLIHIIDREKIRFIHCHNPMGGVTARLAAWLSRQKPYVLYTAHGLHFYKGAPFFNRIIYYPAEWLFANLTDAMITINEEDYRNAGKLPLRRKNHVMRIHGVGVDDKVYRPHREIAAAKRKELGIPENAVHIVTAAELNDNKNQSVVIEALAKLNDKNIYYSICGRGKDAHKLQCLIREKGLEDRVRLTGYRYDMADVLQCADIFAFPSKREGLGVAAVEALLCGIPLIVADNRGTREYARNGVNAIVCRSGKAEEYASAIGRMAHDEKLRKKFAGRCRDSAAEFTLKEVEKSMKRIYGKTLREAGVSVLRRG